MDERIKLIRHLEQYEAEVAMTYDVGCHLRLLVEALRAEEDSESDEAGSNTD